MLKGLWAITQKEFLQLWRFPLVLIGLIVGPALELILFAVAIHSDVKHIPLVVADQSMSQASQSYLTAFTDSDLFDVVAAVPDQAGVVHAIDSGQASIGLVIPGDFASAVQRKDAKVLMLVDGSNSFVTQSAYSSATAISQQYAVSSGPSGTQLDLALISRFFTTLISRISGSWFPALELFSYMG